MSREQRAWWPAVPDGGHHQTSGRSHQYTQNTNHWDEIQQNLLRAIPWASPEHIQAQTAELSLHRAGRKQGLDVSLEHNPSHCRSQTYEQYAASLSTPGPAARLQELNGKASGPTQMRSGSATMTPHVLYAALFLSSEQQRILLTRRVSAVSLTALHLEVYGAIGCISCAALKSGLLLAFQVVLLVCLQGAILLLQCQG